MAKSVYSLVLNDDIVKAIDVLAARQGQSRSALINHILAEHASLTTPQKRRQEITAAASRGMESRFNVALSAGGQLTLRTALQYRYNPSLSYVVQMAEGDAAMGEVRVFLRSQNQALLRHLALFFEVWTKLETQTHPKYPPRFTPQNNRYVRLLRQVEGWQSEQAGVAIANYVALLDDCLKAFFGYMQDELAAEDAARQLYKDRWPLLGDASFL